MIDSAPNLIVMVKDPAYLLYGRLRKVLSYLLGGVGRTTSGFWNDVFCKSGACSGGEKVYGWGNWEVCKVHAGHMRGKPALLPAWRLLEPMHNSTLSCA